MNPKIKAGLILALILGISDVAILATYLTDEAAPLAVIIPSVICGLGTIIAFFPAWSKRSRPAFLTIVILRIVSAIGSVIGLSAGGAIAVVSGVFVIVTIVCLVLIWPGVKQTTSY